jgi:hypothetical protein
MSTYTITAAALREAAQAALKGQPEKRGRRTAAQRVFDREAGRLQFNNGSRFDLVVSCRRLAAWARCFDKSENLTVEFDRASVVFAASGSRVAFRNQASGDAPLEFFKPSILAAPEHGGEFVREMLAGHNPVRSVCRQLSPFVAKSDECRPALEFVSVSRDCAVATDASVLAIWAGPFPAEKESLYTVTGEPVKVNWQYPAWRQILPRQIDRRVTLPVREVLAALGGVGRMAGEGVVRFALDRNQLTIAAGDQSGEAKQTLPVNHTGAPLSLLFNAVNLAKCFAAFKTAKAGEVELQIDCESENVAFVAGALTVVIRNTAKQNDKPVAPVAPVAKIETPAPAPIPVVAPAVVTTKPLRPARPSRSLSRIQPGKVTAAGRRREPRPAFRPASYYIARKLWKNPPPRAKSLAK